jgi:hypothetical protein
MAFDAAPAPSRQNPPIEFPHSQLPTLPATPPRMTDSRPQTTLRVLTPLLMGTLLTVIFWPKLWQGGGFIGGDTYTYFLPQKAFFADRLKAGEFPLWNNLVGHGYPILGESQTGALYPLNPLLYRFLSLNAAYVASHLLHYVLAFVGCWLLARRLNLNGWGAALAATVYVYGWFPPRACLEWAIIGGAYLPLAMWTAESLLQTGRVRYAAGLSVAMALSLLAGHYNLAFITTLLVAAYVALRWRFAGVPVDSESPRESVRDAVSARAVLALAGCLVLGYALAAPQLLPSWDLLRHSQRTEVNAEFDPGYGHIPPWYLSQTFTPWIWYARDADPDQALATVDGGSIPSATNKVEAHLYFGLAPLCLALWTLVRGWWTGERLDPRLKILAALGLLFLIYATGWLLPVAKHLPGFGYFRGPGRYGIVTTLSVGLLAGSILTRWTRSGAVKPAFVALIVLAATVADLSWVGGHQWYTFNVSDPPVAHRDESAVRKALSDWPGIPRMLAPGPNLPTLTGFAASPPYLGFGPDAYYELGGRLPDPRFLGWLSGDEPPRDVDVEPQFAWMRDAGVTHLLSMKRLPSGWPIELVWSGFDRLLNPSWARQEPLYLYAIDGALGRVRVEGGAAVGEASVAEHRANRVAVEVEMQRAGRIILTELPWHEWELTLDGARIEFPEGVEAGPSGNLAAPVSRGVPVAAGRHQLAWTYRPGSLWQGAAISLAALLALLALTRWLARRDG